MQAHNVNQRGIVAFVDEIMGMFNTVNQYSKGQLIEQLLTAHSGKPLDITRCSLDIPIHIEQPCINIIGTTQTKRVHELVDKGYGDNGLIDRILFAIPRGIPSVPGNCMEQKAITMVVNALICGQMWWRRYWHCPANMMTRPEW